MKTNLIFKRTVTRDGVNIVETKIVPVHIPHIASGQGWYIQGHTDQVEVITEAFKPVTEVIQEVVTNATAPKFVEVKPGDKFISDIAGTAKLYRRNDKIGIAYRRGKTTYNQNTKDSVCIDDATKNKFFRAVKEVSGSSVKEYAIRAGSAQFDYWNKFLDKEYERQRKNYNLRGFFNG